MSIPVATHAGLDEIPWVPNPAYPGTEIRLLQADVVTGLYVTAGRLPAGLNVGRHHHTGAVHMFTLSGAWGYREHDFVNRAGSYLYEPPGPSTPSSPRRTTPRSPRPSPSSTAPPSTSTKRTTSSPPPMPGPTSRPSTPPAKRPGYPGPRPS